MRHHFQRSLVPILTATTFLLLTGCSINVKKNDNNEDKKVDIDTPFGGIHVSKGADVRDTGLPVYPGAKPKEKSDSDSDEKSANVDISTSAFGLKVVAIEYQTGDAPSKVIAFYKDKLKQFGAVLECHTSGKNHSYGHTSHKGNSNSDSEELKCEGDDNGKTIELKAGTESNQHVVSIDPQDKGADFALVYVRIRGKEGTI
jgi:hypothetical protein